MSREETKTAIRAVSDAITFRAITDSLQDGLDSASLFIAYQQDVIRQGQKTIDAKDETSAFYKSQAEMWAHESRSLERKNFFWRTYAGIVTSIAAVSVMIILK